MCPKLTGENLLFWFQIWIQRLKIHKNTMVSKKIIDFFLYGCVIIPNVIFPKLYHLVECHFLEKALNRMPFHGSDSAMLYCLCCIIIGTIYYRSSSASITGRMTECFHFCAADQREKAQCFVLLNIQLLLLSRLQTSTGIDFDTTLRFWTRNHFQWKIILMQQQFL